MLKEATVEPVVIVFAGVAMIGVADLMFWTSHIGGNGGKGGDVILECSSAVWDFSGLQYHVNAMKGGHGESKNMIGTRGEDKVVRVPVGTVIHLVRGELPSKTVCDSSEDLDPWDLSGSLDVEKVKPLERSVVKATDVADDDSTLLSDDDSLAAAQSLSDDGCSHRENRPPSQYYQQTQYDVAELTKPGQRIVVALGGDGGFGSVAASKDSKQGKVNKLNSSSTTENADNELFRTIGSSGSEAVLVLELKSIADVGLVGMPNAGKSTLLGAISRAKPRIGHYAFTTLRPNLGKLSFDDLSITIADIPGLIKGAHEDRGLGHSFLRHIERTKVLAYVVDLAAALDGKTGLPPWVQLKDLIMELEHHQKGLSDRPSLIVANKFDEEGAEEVYKELKRRVSGVSIYPVCAVLEEGIPELKAGLRMLVDCGESLPLTLSRLDCT